jgi:hypothetical protein
MRDKSDIRDSIIYRDDLDMKDSQRIDVRGAHMRRTS